MHHFASAARDYEAILAKLPDDQKGFGYVDLGRAQEKAGDISSALKSYEAAVNRDPDNPAPFLHLGILKSRQQDAAGAEAAYNKAEDLYRLEQNIEGLGEVEFQRGHSANQRGDSGLARKSLNECLQIARQIASAQLEVRALTQLSNVEYNSDQDDQSIVDAERARQEARSYHLEYWATDALIREGNAYLDKGKPQDLVKAEADAAEALKEAQQNQHAHLEANAQFTLASLRDISGKRDEEIEHAKPALRYYKDFGFLGQAADSENLIVRAQRGKGDLKQALQSATELLDISRRSDSPARLEIAQEGIGSILLELQDYPKSLEHFEEALKLSRMTNAGVAYQILHCADTLWRLGRYRDAESMLDSIPPKAKERIDISSGMSRVQAYMYLSQRRFAEVLVVAGRALKSSQNLTSPERLDFEEASIVADGELGRMHNVQIDGQRILTLARNESNDQLVAEASLAVGWANLRANAPELARPLVQSANTFFSSRHEPESEWMSLMLMAEVLSAMGNKITSTQKANQAIDRLKTIEQDWGSLVFKSYSGRPDIQIATRQLSKLSAQ